MNAVTYPKTRQSAVNMYKEKFGVQVSEWMLKHVATKGAFRQLKREMMKAIQTNQEITD